MSFLPSCRFLCALALLLGATLARARADPPPDWTGADINATGGSVDVLSDSSWTVAARGADIWSRADEFQYVYRTLEGDGSVTARILSQTTNSSPWAKAGVMLRDNDSAGSPHVMVVMTPGNGVDVQWRREADGESESAGGNLYPRRLPLYLRVQRRGDRCSTFVSEDAVTWTQVGSNLQIKMGRSILAGVCVTSTNKNLSSTARFDRVTVGDDMVATGPASVQALVRDAGALVVWDSVPHAAGYHVYRRGPGDPRFARVTRLSIHALSYTDLGLTNGSVYRYQVTALVDGRESTPSDVATVTPMVAIQNSLYGYTIGTTFPGSAVQEADGSITVRGSGWDIWGRQDGFYFLASSVEGDAVVTVKVLESPSHSHDWAKAGIMIRDSLAWDARNTILEVTPKNGIAFQWRKSTGGESEYAPGPNPRYPMYLRIVRQGDWITPYVSLDGISFEPAASAVRLDLLNRELWIGLAVTATSDRRLCTARFREFTVVPP